MLSVVNLTFDYGMIPLLTDVHWSLKPGNLLHVYAKNGRGKTTLFRLLTGFLRPNAGDIIWDNSSIYDQLSHYQQQLCYIGHKLGVTEILTVKQHLQWDNGVGSKDVTSLLNQWGLLPVADTRCAQLSSGQRRRLALSRLTCTSAAIWILDEPFVGLDDKAIDIVSNCITAHQSLGGMVVLASHHALPSSLTTVSRYDL